MNIITTTEIYAQGEQPITPAGLYDLRHNFFKKYQHQPEILKLHPAARNMLLQVIDREYLPDVERNTIFGMQIKIDETLADGEWRIGKTLEVHAEEK